MATAELEHRLLESSSGYDRIDRDAGIIYGVKVLGLVSKNDRRYLPKAVSDALPLYEGVAVNIDHQRDDPNSRVIQDRPMRDRWGVLRNARIIDGEIYANLHYIKSHPMTEMLVEAAEKFPETFGLSHDATGDERAINGERQVIEIWRVNSVDVVSRPATNAGLFESVEIPIHSAFGSRMKKSLKEAFCRTGKGGKVDNSCSGKKGTGRGRSTGAKGASASKGATGADAASGASGVKGAGKKKATKASKATKGTKATEVPVSPDLKAKLNHLAASSNMPKHFKPAMSHLELNGKTYKLAKAGAWSHSYVADDGTKAMYHNGDGGHYIAHGTDSDGDPNYVPAHASNQPGVHSRDGKPFGEENKFSAFHNNELYTNMGVATGIKDGKKKDQFEDSSGNKIFRDHETSVWTDDNGKYIGGPASKTTKKAAAKTASPKSYEARVAAYEKQGMTTSDAQGVVDAEDLKADPNSPIGKPVKKPTTSKSSSAYDVAGSIKKDLEINPVTTSNARYEVGGFGNTWLTNTHGHGNHDVGSPTYKDAVNKYHETAKGLIDAGHFDSAEHAQNYLDSSYGRHLADGMHGHGDLSKIRGLSKTIAIYKKAAGISSKSSPKTAKPAKAAKSLDVTGAKVFHATDEKAYDDKVRMWKTAGAKIKTIGDRTHVLNTDDGSVMGYIDKPKSGSSGSTSNLTIVGNDPSAQVMTLGGNPVTAKASDNLTIVGNAAGKAAKTAKPSAKTQPAASSGSDNYFQDYDGNTYYMPSSSGDASKKSPSEKSKSKSASSGIHSILGAIATPGSSDSLGGVFKNRYTPKIGTDSKDVQAAIDKAGFEFESMNGFAQEWKHPKTGEKVSVSYHPLTNKVMHMHVTPGKAANPKSSSGAKDALGSVLTHKPVSHNPGLYMNDSGASEKAIHDALVADGYRLKPANSYGHYVKGLYEKPAGPYGSSTASISFDPKTGLPRSVSKSSSVMKDSFNPKGAAMPKSTYRELVESNEQFGRFLESALGDDDSIGGVGVSYDDSSDAVGQMISAFRSAMGSLIDNDALSTKEKLAKMKLILDARESALESIGADLSPVEDLEEGDMMDDEEAIDESANPFASGDSEEGDAEEVDAEEVDDAEGDMDDDSTDEESDEDEDEEDSPGETNQFAESDDMALEDEEEEPTVMSESATRVAECGGKDCKDCDGKNMKESNVDDLRLENAALRVRMQLLESGCEVTDVRVKALLPLNESERVQLMESWTGTQKRGEREGRPARSPSVFTESAAADGGSYPTDSKEFARQLG
jgi:hypothetical protein